MFHKPFRVKTQSAIKGSDRKKLRSEFGRQYPSVTDARLSSIFNSKDEMTIAKVCTHAGDDIIVYFLQKNPVCFEVHKVIYPTVYLLWKNPDLIPTLTTWPDVFKKLEGGADLMLPGVIVSGEPGPRALGDFGKGLGCAVVLRGNRAAVAVGQTLMSSVEMYEAAMRGKGVAILHTYLDHLWSAGDHSELPFIAEAPPSVPSELSFTAEVTHPVVSAVSEIDTIKATTDKNAAQLADQLAAASIGDDHSTTTEATAVMAGTQAVARIVSTSDVVESSEFTTVLEETERTSDTMADVGDDCDEILEAATVREATTDSTEVTSDVITTSRDAVDSLLYQCFLYALKTSARKAELPLLTSAFFRNHMVRCCPKGSVLDVKKSSYKKLSKFLASMQKQGFIEVKELTKGVESVISINQDHLELRMFQIPDWPLSSADVEPSLSGNVEEKFSYSPPEVTDMFQVTAAVLPLLTGRRKGEALLAHEVRQHVTDYVRANNLQHPDNKSLVRLDATLCDAVVPRGDYVEVLRWDELIDRCLAKMSAVHRVTFTGCEPRIHRGHIEPISLDVQQRGANKKVTVIRNLETYGIDLEQFASTVQKGVACSTSVGPQTGKPKCLQVNVQGNQINYIGQLLHDKYQLPLKYISGLEKAPKAPKKKKT